MARQTDGRTECLIRGPPAPAGVGVGARPRLCFALVQEAQPKAWALLGSHENLLRPTGKNELGLRPAKISVGKTSPARAARPASASSSWDGDGPPEALPHFPFCRSVTK